MFFIREFVSKIFPCYQWYIENTRNEIYLTFDDGPTPEITNWILSKLNEYGAKATFFCIGNNVVRYPELYQSILLEGHAVGNHSHHHLKGWGTSTSVYVSDVERAARQISSPLFRPPYGRIGPSQTQILRQRFKIIMWDCLSFDYNRNNTPHQCARNVRENARVGSIVVFHDSLKAERNMKYALSSTLDHFSEKGFNMGTLLSGLYPC